MSEKSLVKTKRVKPVTLLTELKKVVEFDLPKSINKSHSIIVSINECSIDNILSVRPKDIYLLSVLLERAKTHFVRVVNDLTTRYQLNILLTLYSACGTHISVGSLKQKPVPRSLSKSDIYTLIPYSSNKRLSDDLNELASKGCVEIYQHKGKTGRTRKMLILTRRGYDILAQFDLFYSDYLKSCNYH